MKAAGPDVLLHTTSLQRFPPYIEVPPHIEAKQMDPYFPTVLSYSSNPLLLKDDFKILILSGCWQAICNNYIWVDGL